MNRIFILSFFLFQLTTFSFSQIQIGGEQPKEKKAKSEEQNSEKKEVKLPSNGIQLFFGASAGSSYRTLVPNDKNPLFAKDIAERADESNITSWNVNLGFRSDINKFMMWEAGLSYLRNGEAYNYQATDTLHNYTNNYQWIGVPVKLYFKYDLNTIRIQAGAGIIAHMQGKFKRTETFDGKYISEKTETIKTRDGYNNMGLSYVINAGVTYHFSPRIGIFAMFEYRQQLTNTYLKTSGFIHKGNFIGANFGLTIDL